jgi:hypothetical protein
MDFLGKCLFNLHAIGEIPRGKKINTRGECLSVEKETFVPQWAQRFADGRTKVFRDVGRYVSTVIEISERVMESKYLTAQGVITDINNDNNARAIDYNALAIRAARIEELQKIYYGLIEAKRGIAGQTDTYKDDTDVCAIILDLLTKIDQHTAKLKKFLQSMDQNIDN